MFHDAQLAICGPLPLPENPCLSSEWLGNVWMAQDVYASIMIPSMALSQLLRQAYHTHGLLEGV